MPGSFGGLRKYHGERIGSMPITPFLGDQEFDPETTRIMGVAFEMARASVKRDWGGRALPNDCGGLR